MTLDDLAVAYSGQREPGCSRDVAAEAHGTAQIALGVTVFDLAFGGLPFGDQRNHRVRRARVELGAVRALETGDVARKLDHRHLHAKADAEIRNAVRARVVHGLNLAFDAALAETARHQDRVGPVEQAPSPGYRPFPSRHNGC